VVNSKRGKKAVNEYRSGDNKPVAKAAVEADLIARQSGRALANLLADAPEARRAGE
jgi:hypothetical protein